MWFEKCVDLTPIKVIFRYLKDQHFMTVVDVSDLHSLDLLGCLPGFLFRPINVYSDMDSIKFSDTIDTSSVSSYPTTNGYYIRCEADEILKENGFYEKLSKFNPRSKVILNLIDVDLETMKEILKIGYHKYKLLNVATVLMVPQFAGGSIASLKSITAYLCLYNPFAGNAHERTPEVRCWSFENNVKEKILEMENFQAQRLKDLNKFPLKISIFEYEMKCVAVYDTNGNISHYTYPDGELISTVAKIMNFMPIYKPILEGPKYGLKIPGGIFTGSLGDSEYERVDLVANPKLISNYNTTNSVFLQPVAMTKLFFIVKKRFTRKKISTIILFQLDNVGQAIATLLFFLFPVIYFFINKIELSLFRVERRKDVVKEILYVIALFNNVSVKHSTLAASRIVVAMMLFYTLMATGLFQGSIIKDLNQNQNIGRINKIDQIIEQKFAIGMDPILTYAFQEEGDDKVSKALNKITRSIRKSFYLNEEAIELLKLDDKFAYLLGSEMTGSYLNNFYDNETGENYLEVVPESAFEFYIAMMVPKSSPFIDRFNQIINEYMETGLYQYNMKKASDDNQKIWIYRVKHGLVPHTHNRALKLLDLQDVFNVFLTNCAMTCLIFALEITHKFITVKWNKRKSNQSNLFIETF